MCFDFLLLFRFGNLLFDPNYRPYAYDPTEQAVRPLVEPSWYHFNLHRQIQTDHYVPDGYASKSTAKSTTCIQCTSLSKLMSRDVNAYGVFQINEQALTVRIHHAIQTATTKFVVMRTFCVDR